MSEPIMSFNVTIERHGNGDIYLLIPPVGGGAKIIPLDVTVDIAQALIATATRRTQEDYDAMNVERFGFTIDGRLVFIYAAIRTRFAQLLWGNW